MNKVNCVAKLIGCSAFTNKEVFVHLSLEHLPGTAEYLEISLPTLRRYVSAKKLWLLRT